MLTTERRKALHTLALATVVLFAAQVAAETVAPESVGLSSERLHRIDELVQRNIDAGEITGAVTLVARNGKVAYVTAQGVMDVASKKPMQADTMFRIASMSKPVAAVAILMLMEEGKVRLNDPVAKFIPAFGDLDVAMAKTGGSGPSGPGPAAPAAASPGGAARVLHRARGARRSRCSTCSRTPRA